MAKGGSMAIGYFQRVGLAAFFAGMVVSNCRSEAVPLAEVDIAAACSAKRWQMERALPSVHAALRNGYPGHAAKRLESLQHERVVTGHRVIQGMPTDVYSSFSTTCPQSPVLQEMRKLQRAIDSQRNPLWSGMAKQE